MKEINVLSSKIFNRIAAGEVVERPSSVVKELVENSIDAGATNISIEIIDGGITSVRVCDNGDGIEKSQLKRALMPHATSKISTIADLDAISTLGFRGEALASIASVSKITIKSKTKEQDIGAQIYAEGGNESTVDDCGVSEGTEITVNNLFYNTPVRAKFLKSIRSEESEITQTVARFILGKPDISFKYSANGKVILQSFGDGLEAAFVAVYGINTLNDCFYIDAEKNGISVKGYIGKQFFSKPNRTYQTVFLNGRYISNNTVSSAIGNAYASYLMKRQYPLFVLNIDMPIDAVDVNVHPNKIDVRFLNNQIVYGALYSIVSKVLDGSKEALSIVTDDKDVETENIQKTTDKISDDYVTQNPYETFGKINFSDGFEKNNTTIETEQNFNTKNEEKKNVKDIFAENKAFLEELERRKEKENEKSVEQSTIIVEEDLRFIGQALNTFLIYQAGKDLLFVDQHALHERILFDKLIKNTDSDKEIQPLLIPFIITLNSVESDFIYNNLSLFREMGIEIESFGENAYKVSALPIYLADLNVQKFFDVVLEDLNSLKTINSHDLIKEKIAMKACKSAIKSGDVLSESEVAILTETIKKNLGLKCPHGRPVAVRINRTEIDKWFKRIV